MTSPTTIINPLLDAEAQRPETFCYENAFMVAHSLGAIVSRRALLNASRENAFWTDKVGVILFAPAHMGAHILGLVMEALMGIPIVGGIVSAIWRLRFQSLRDVEPECVTLRQLQEHTRDALARGSGRCHIAQAAYVLR
jgi:alpha-beta hydrolase superfamily lysophospholipase